MNAQDLKNSILQLAIQGKLVGQRKEEGTAKELLEQIKAEKEQLIKDKKIKKEKILPEIAEDEIPFDIPESWLWTRVSNVADMYTGNSIAVSIKESKYTNVKQGYEYIATKDVGFNHLIDYENGVKIPFEEDKFRYSYKNSILMCIEGGSAGRKIGILDRTVCFGNKLCSFNAIAIESLFLYYYLQSPQFTQVFRGGITGIIGGVSINKLKTIIIPIPPLKEQKRIVDKIEELMSYVEKYGEAYSKIAMFNKKFPEDMQKSILQYAIQGKLVEQREEEGTAEELYNQIQEEKAKLMKEGKIKKEKLIAEITDEEIPFEIPYNWKWVRLSTICKSITDGDHQAPPQVLDGIPFIVISNLSSGEIDFSNTRHVTKKYFDSLSLERIAENGDLLFTVTGSYGIPVRVNSNLRFCFQRHIALLKVLISNDYIFYLLKSPLVKGQCDKAATGTAQKTVGLNSLKSIVIPLPPLEEQKRIVEAIKTYLPYCQQLIK